MRSKGSNSKLYYVKTLYTNIAFDLNVESCCYSCNRSGVERDVAPW